MLEAHGHTCTEKIKFNFHTPETVYIFRIYWDGHKGKSHWAIRFNNRVWDPGADGELSYEDWFLQFGWMGHITSYTIVTKCDS